MPTLSVVVPIDSVPSDFKFFLNRLLESVAPLNGSEIIVVDGTSGTGIPRICREHGVCLLRGIGSRFSLMSKGAAVAQGDYLLFIGADTVLPAEFADLWRSVRRRGRVWGFFSVRFRNSPLGLRWLARIISLRSRLSAVAIAEQGLFVQRNAWKLVGDADEPESDTHTSLCRRLRTLTAPCTVRQAVENDAEQWGRLSWVRIVRAGLSSRLGAVDAVISDGKQGLERDGPGRKKRTPELP